MIASICALVLALGLQEPPSAATILERSRRAVLEPLEAGRCFKARMQIELLDATGSPQRYSGELAQDARSSRMELYPTFDPTEEGGGAWPDARIELRVSGERVFCRRIHHASQAHAPEREYPLPARKESAEALRLIAAPPQAWQGLRFSVRRVEAGDQDPAASRTGS